MYWCSYIVKAVDGMRVWRAEMCVCPLQCRLSLTLSVVIAVRQTVIILGRAPLGGKTQEGEGGSWMLWCLPSHVFPRAFVVIPSFSRPFALLWRRPFISTGWHKRIISVLARFLLCLSQNLIKKKIKKFKRHSPQIWWFNNGIDFSRLETSDSAAGSRVNSQSAAPLSFLSPDTCDWCPRP